MGANTAVLEAVTKTIYEGTIREQLDSTTVALKRLESSSSNISDEVGGKFVTFPIHTRRNSGIGARNENELLPVAGQQGHAAARVGLKYLYGAVQLTGQALKLVDKNYQAFQAALEIELDGLTRDLSVDQNRQVWGNGRGDLAKVVSGTGALNNNSYVVETVKYLQLDMMVDVYAANAVPGASPILAGAKILSIDEDANTVVINGAAQTPVAGMTFIRAGNYWREWTGLSAIINDSGTLYGVDPAIEPLWKSKIDRSGTARAISENLLTRMADKIDVGGGKTTVIFTTHGVRREYAALLQQQRQYVNTTKFEGGFSGIEFVTDRGVIPIVVDKDAPKGTATFVNEKAITRYRESDWSWMDMDGSKWTRVPGYDAYGAMMHQYSELGTDRRNTHGRIENLAEDE